MLQKSQKPYYRNFGQFLLSSLKDDPTNTKILISPCEYTHSYSIPARDDLKRSLLFQSH